MILQSRDFVRLRDKLNTLCLYCVRTMATTYSKMMVTYREGLLLIDLHKDF